MAKDVSSYWIYDFENGWSKALYPNHLFFDTSTEFIESLGYPSHPDMFFGNEIDFIAAFENKLEEMFLIQLKVSDMEKIVFAKDLPSLLEILSQFIELLNSHLETETLIDSMEEYE